MLKAIQGILDTRMHWFGSEMFQQPTPPSRRESKVSAKGHPAAGIVQRSAGNVIVDGNAQG
jgi:hypothetical protein